MNNGPPVASDDPPAEVGASGRQRRFLYGLVAVVCVAILVVLVAQMIGGCWIDVGNEMGYQPSVGYVEPPRSSAPDTAVPFQGLDVMPGAPAPLNPVSASDASVADGKGVYGIFCLACHGEPGGQTGLVGVLFAPPPPHLDQVAGSLSDGQIYLTATQGVGHMPALGSRMSELDRWNIVNYLRTTQPQPGVTPPADPRERGAAVFTSQCSGCHGPTGGGALGPALHPSSLLAEMTPGEIAAFVRAGRAGHGMPSFGGRLSDASLADVAALLKDLQDSGPAFLEGYVRRQEQATTTTTPGGDAALIARGTTVFSDKCQRCHGAEGSGGIGPPLKPSDLIPTLTDAQVRAIIENGSPGTVMPAWKGTLSPDDITALVTLLRSWQQGAATTTTAPATATTLPTSGAEQALLARGAAVFSANCQTCHGADGVGGIGPPLKPSDLIPTLTDAQVRAIIENGSPGTVMPAWKGKLSPDDITAAVALLRSWQQTTSTSAVGGATAPSAATTAISAGPTTATASPTTAQATASTLPATTATASGADQALIAKGAAVFSANCQPCHGAEGVGGIGPKLKPNAFVGRSADAQVRQTIENGRPGTPMPAWKGKLAPGDITAALALLRSWQQTTTTGSGGPTTVPGGGSTTVQGGGPPATAAAGAYATIPFTHQPHMEKGGMSCLFCHAQARRGPSADLPPLQLCAGCHRWLTVQTASTKAVVAAYDSGAQVSWPRVYREPDFVFFTHQVHIELAKLECSTCHGDVAAMGLARKVSQLNMKFCIDCHKKQTDLSFLMNCEICHK